MGLDINRLKNVRRKSDGKIVAQCPACAECGNDTKGEHLAVFTDGRYSCVVNPQDKAHNKLIFKLVGANDGLGKFTKPFEVVRHGSKPSTTIMTLGGFAVDRLVVKPADPEVAKVVVEPMVEPPVDTDPPVEQPKAAPPVESPEDIEWEVLESRPVVDEALYRDMDPAIRDFLLKPASEEWVTL